MQYRAKRKNHNPFQINQAAEILESISDSFFALDREWCFSYVNQRAAVLFKIKAEDLIGQNIWKQFPQLLDTEANSVFSQVMEEGQPRELDARGIFTGRWYSVRVYPSAQGILVFGQDITGHKRDDEALKESEEKYRSLFENMTERFSTGEIILDAEGRPYDLRYQEVNQAWEKWMKIPRARAIGKTYRELIARILPNVIEVFGKVALTGEPGTLEIYSSNTDSWVSTYVYSPGKGRYAAITADITKRKKAEEELKKLNEDLETRIKERTARLAESEEKYRSLVENANEAIVIVQDGRLKFFNKKALKLSGYSRKELASMPFAELVDIQDRGLIRERYQKLMRGEEVPLNYAFRIITRDKNVRWVEINAVSMSWEGRLASMALLTDITERKRMEQSIKEYAQRITQVQEEERKRIAYELHDDTAQYLSILKLQLDSLLQSKKIQDSEIIQKLKYLEKDASRAVEDVRRYSHELRPSVLEHMGLQAAIEQIAEDINKLQQFTVEVYAEGIEPQLSEEIKLGLFRIAQEALNNTRKHSQASNSTISLDFKKQQVRLIISDNGIGFDTQEARTRSSLKGSLGLVSMQERAQLIGADFKIESAPGTGTRVIATAKL